MKVQWGVHKEMVFDSKGGWTLREHKVCRDLCEVLMEELHPKDGLEITGDKMERFVGVVSLSSSG